MVCLGQIEQSRATQTCRPQLTHHDDDGDDDGHERSPAEVPTLDLFWGQLIAELTSPARWTLAADLSPEDAAGDVVEAGVGSAAGPALVTLQCIARLTPASEKPNHS